MVETDENGEYKDLKEFEQASLAYQEKFGRSMLVDGMTILNKESLDRAIENNKELAKFLALEMNHYYPVVKECMDSFLADLPEPVDNSDTKKENESLSIIQEDIDRENKVVIKHSDFNVLKCINYDVIDYILSKKEKTVKKSDIIPIILAPFSRSVSFPFNMDECFLYDNKDLIIKSIKKNWLFKNEGKWDLILGKSNIIHCDINDNVITNFRFRAWESTRQKELNEGKSYKIDYSLINKEDAQMPNQEVRIGAPKKERKTRNSDESHENQLMSSIKKNIYKHIDDSIELFLGFNDSIKDIIKEEIREGNLSKSDLLGLPENKIDLEKEMLLNTVLKSEFNQSLLCDYLCKRKKSIYYSDFDGKGRVLKVNDSNNTLLKMAMYGTYQLVDCECSDDLFVESDSVYITYEAKYFVQVSYQDMQCIIAYR